MNLIRGSASNRRSLAVVLSLLIGLLIWLWPIGLGGRMPVGGDVTQFFLGLMAVLGTSLREGHLPVWNGLWGFGFPGLGESQMGVYYPPHLLLYGLLPTEHAYVLSLLLHTLWGGLGAWWAARQFEVSSVGSGLAAAAFSASGFFVIHMPHPWGYTTGSWLPWAIGLGWAVASSPSLRRPRSYFLLTIVLVMQVLPGHFQIAFMTQCVLLMIAAWSLIGLPSRTGAVAQGNDADPRSRRTFHGLAIAGCVALVFPLAALQLWPTMRLARLASAQRDYEYLSGFAATPLHLVSLVAPRMFHESPLWRPLIWDPFHTSPEEMLIYVGLVPCFLAILTVRHEFRRDPRVRFLTLLTVLSLLLSLGPYVPGFRWLIELPGFSFFRAPARWSLVTSLAMAILAGKGLDRVVGWPRPGRSFLLLCAGSAAWIFLLLGLLELGLAGGSQGGIGLVTGVCDAVLRCRPWVGDPDYRSLVQEAKRPASDARIPPQLIRAHLASPPRDVRSFVQRRGPIYVRELALTAAILAGTSVLGLLTLSAKRRGWLPAGLLILTAVDLLLFSQTRPISLGPLRPLNEQSTVLAELSRHPRGTRVADPFRNLSMLVGLAPISSYRTLDLPALGPLTSLARGPIHQEQFRPLVNEAMRATGAGLRVLDPVEVAMESLAVRSDQSTRSNPTIEDPALARWHFGESWLEEQGPWASRFRILRPDAEPSIAWFLPESAVPRPEMLDTWGGEVGPLLRILARATPLELASDGPLRQEVSVNAPGAGWLLITQLADPQWRGRWTGVGGTGSLDADIKPTFRRRRGDGGWQRIPVPGPGRWTLNLEYDAADVRQGLALSAGAWLAWACLVLVLELRAKGRRSVE